jgi:hypothetical protein
MGFQEQADRAKRMDRSDNIGARDSHTAPVANTVDELIDGYCVVVFVEAQGLAEDELDHPVLSVF